MDTNISGTAGAAVGQSSTMADPMQAARERISTIQSRLSETRSKALLSEVREEAGNVEALANRVADLANQVREMGYAWEKDLEPRCLDYRQRWASLKPNVMSAIEQQSADLRAREAQMESQVNWDIQRAVTAEAAQASLTDAEAALNSLEGAADAAAGAVRGMFSQFSTDLSALEEHLKQVHWMLDQATQSRVSWLPGEALVLAVKGQWDRASNDAPKGTLMLSDQRVLFERNEDVATKKVLFVTTAKRRVQEVLMDAALTELATVEASKRGFMGHEDHLDLQFAASSKWRAVHMHIDGQDCQEWQAMMNRAKSGGLDDTRLAPISEGEKARLRAAPTACPNCGSPLSAPVLRGQTEIRCPACGNVSRF